MLEILHLTIKKKHPEKIKHQIKHNIDTKVFLEKTNKKLKISKITIRINRYNII
jgi:hypothetical protein